MITRRQCALIIASLPRWKYLIAQEPGPLGPGANGLRHPDRIRPKNRRRMKTRDRRSTSTWTWSMCFSPCGRRTAERSASNLTKDDFHILEDGQEQAISQFSRETNLPLKLGLLVDISASQSRLDGHGA